MKMHVIGCLLLIFISCKNTGRGKLQAQDTQSVPEARDTPPPKPGNAQPAAEPDTTTPQAITLAKRPPGPPVDTVLDIDIDDVSLEGSGVKATYKRDTLRSAVWEVFGETFQSKITYTFTWNGKVQVKEKYSKYKVSMGDVKSDKDMNVHNTIYQIDTSGLLLTKGVPDTEGAWEAFQAFKKNVPMILKP